MSDHFYKIDTAFHEAGHVVVGTINLLKIDYSYIEIDSGWTNSSFISPSKKFNSHINNYLNNSWLYFNYAGLMTDRHNFTLNTGSKKYPSIIKIGASIDVKEASNYIIKYNLAAPGKERSAFKQKMQRRTMKMVQKYWNDIILITHAIYNKRHHTIYYDDIVNVLTKQSSNKLFWKEKFKDINYLYSIYYDDLTSAHFKEII